MLSCHDTPKNKIVLKDIQTTGRTKITLLGSDKKYNGNKKVMILK